MDRSRLIKLCIALAIPLIVILIPREAIPIDGLTVTQHRVVAIFALALCFWVLEPIPIFATSVLVIVVELMTISNKSIKWLLPAEEAPEGFGELVPYKSIMATFADPIIMLFLGGFFLGAAATKYKMDTNLGRVLLRPFGTRTALVMLGMMVITAVFSMFMSNTATTAMMLAVLMPVLRSIDADDPARISFALAIPFAANIGGIGTPIGTPPNAVGMKYLVDDGGQPLVTFAGWMGFGVPFVIALLVLAWLLLLFMFRPSKPNLTVKFKGRWMKSGQAWIVYITSAATILLWLTGGTVHGMTSHTVALIPVAVFCCTGIMTSQDLKGLSWDVLWLVAGRIRTGPGVATDRVERGIGREHPVCDVPGAVDHRDRGGVDLPDGDVYEQHRGGEPGPADHGGAGGFADFAGAVGRADDADPRGDVCGLVGDDDADQYTAQRDGLRYRLDPDRAYGQGRRGGGSAWFASDRGDGHHHEPDGIL